MGFGVATAIFAGSVGMALRGISVHKASNLRIARDLQNVKELGCISEILDAPLGAYRVNPRIGEFKYIGWEETDVHRGTLSLIGGSLKHSRPQCERRVACDVFVASDDITVSLTNIATSGFTGSVYLYKVDGIRGGTVCSNSLEKLQDTVSYHNNKGNIFTVVGLTMSFFSFVFAVALLID